MTLDKVIPLLVYRDIHSAYDFLLNAFGFKPGFVHESPEGDAIHGEVHVGDTIIWLHRVTAEHTLASPETVDVAGDLWGHCTFSGGILRTGFEKLILFDSH